MRLLAMDGWIAARDSSCCFCCFSVEPQRRLRGAQTYAHFVYEYLYVYTFINGHYCAVRLHNAALFRADAALFSRCDDDRQQIFDRELSSVCGFSRAVVHFIDTQFSQLSTQLYPFDLRTSMVLLGKCNQLHKFHATNLQIRLAELLDSHCYAKSTENSHVLSRI